MSIITDEQLIELREALDVPEEFVEYQPELSRGVWENVENDEHAGYGTILYDPDFRLIALPMSLGTLNIAFSVAHTFSVNSDSIVLLLELQNDEGEAMATVTSPASSSFDEVICSFMPMMHLLISMIVKSKLAVSSGADPEDVLAAIQNGLFFGDGAQPQEDGSIMIPRSSIESLARFGPSDGGGRKPYTKPTITEIEVPRF